MTRNRLIKVAKLEMARWHGLPNGLVLAILFCYIEHVVNGEPIEKTFFGEGAPQPDYEI